MTSTAIAKKKLTTEESSLVALKNYIERKNVHDLFRQAVPGSLAAQLTPERIQKVILAAAARTPDLLKCTPTSIVRATSELVTLGLDPSGGTLGEAYLVPYNNKKKVDGREVWVREAQGIVGYRGLIVLARRSGMMKKVSANLVYGGDQFDIDLASGQRPIHKPAPIVGKERGEILYVYCVADYTDGGFDVEFMTKSDVDAIRGRSKAGNSGPWVSDYGQMARKTVIRRAAHYWPLSVELAEAFRMTDKEFVDADHSLETSSFEVLSSADGEVLGDGGEPLQLTEGEGNDALPDAEPSTGKQDEIMAELKSKKGKDVEQLAGDWAKRGE